MNKRIETTIRIPDHLHAMLTATARARGLTLNALVLVYLEQGINREGTTNEDPFPLRVIALPEDGILSFD